MLLCVCWWPDGSRRWKQLICELESPHSRKWVNADGRMAKRELMRNNNLQTNGLRPKTFWSSFALGFSLLVCFLFFPRLFSRLHHDALNSSNHILALHWLIDLLIDWLDTCLSRNSRPLTIHLHSSAPSVRYWLSVCSDRPHWPTDRLTVSPCWSQAGSRLVVNTTSEWWRFTLTVDSHLSAAPGGGPWHSCWCLFQWLALNWLQYNRHNSSQAQEKTL